MNIMSSSVDETRQCGAGIARSSGPGDVFALCGDLGCGKSEFVRGFVAALAPRMIVRSPSFTLVNIYETPLFPIYHFDFYRLNNPTELLEIGFHEYVRGSGVCLVEWADMFPAELPEATRFIRFADKGVSSRSIEFED